MPSHPQSTAPGAAHIRPTALLPAIFVCTLIVALSIAAPSSTRMQIWPWAGLAALGWLLPIAVVLCRFACGRPCSRFGGLIDAGLAALALAAIASAFTSPLRATVLPHLLPVLGACALPFALLPFLQPAGILRTGRALGAVTAVILLASLLLWLQPWTRLVIPSTRNAEPFGHANITGSFAVLAAGWLAAQAVRETSRLPRLLCTLGTLLAILAAITSGSRGAVIALAAAGTAAAAISLLRRGRLLAFSLLALLIISAVAASNSRLRELVVHGRWSATARESNDQRFTMIAGGLRLGAERPWLGWGAGSVPHVFPRVRAGLPGAADNFLQLHNTPVQLWATLGSGGLLAVLLIAAGLAGRLRAAPWDPVRTALAAALIAAAAVLLFDHPFATPAFTLLAAALLAAWAGPAPRPVSSTAARITAGVGALLLVPVALAAGRDLSARRAYSAALDHAVIDDRTGYAAALRRAAAAAPADPYYPHLLAAHLATGHPFPGARGASPQAAAALLADTLVLNPDLEYAHYNLGWLLLSADASAAAAHFRRSARLAPQRGAVYLGLGLARIQMNDTEGAVRALAAEWLLQPAIAWSPIWQQPPLAALTPRVRRLATAAALARGRDPWSDHLATPATFGAPYRRLRTGYGVLMGQPEGPPPVDFNIQTRVILPPGLQAQVPGFGWLDGRALLQFLDPPAP